VTEAVIDSSREPYGNSTWLLTHTLWLWSWHSATLHFTCTKMVC